MNEERKNYYMNRNIKLYPFYLAFTWDIVFVWTIIILFYTNVKGLTYSQAIFLDSLLYISAFILSVPVSKLISKVKPLLASQIANLFAILFLLLVIFGTHYVTFMLAEVCFAIYMIISNIKNSILLSDTLRIVKRDKEYNRIYGGGLGMYYFIDAICCIFATTIYQFNPYICFIVAIVVMVLVELLSLLLKEPSKFQESNIDIAKKEIDSTKQKSKSKRKYKKKTFWTAFIISMLAYCIFFRGMASIDASVLKIYLQELTDNAVIPLWSFGILYAGYRLSNSLASKFQFKYELKFGVRSLILFAIIGIISIVGTGLIYLFAPLNVVTIIITLLLFYMFSSIRPANHVFIMNYLQVCLTSKDLDKGYTYKNMAEYLGYGLCSSLYSILLGVFNDNFAYSNLVYAGIIILPLIISLIFFIRALVKKYASKYTVIKKEYVEDEF